MNTWKQNYQTYLLRKQKEFGSAGVKDLIHLTNILSEKK